ncbi:MAG TPA: hypothetical protein VGG12_02855 [Methylovirgula sp.]
MSVRATREWAANLPAGLALGKGREDREGAASLGWYFYLKDENKKEFLCRFCEQDAALLRDNASRVSYKRPPFS